jgi:hypothetical protein
VELNCRYHILFTFGRNSFSADFLQYARKTRSPAGIEHPPSAAPEKGRHLSAAFFDS